MTHVNLFDPRFASPLDVLVKNFFDKDAIFDKPSRQAITHPIDVFEDVLGLTFEVACVGLDKKDVSIAIEEDILKVSYKKGEDQQTADDKRYYHTGVRKSSFDFGWKIARRFNLSKANSYIHVSYIQVLKIKKL